MSKHDDRREDPWLPWRVEGDNRRSGSGASARRSPVKRRARSRPRSAGQKYLELYLLQKDQERLEMVGELATRMQREAARNWLEVEAQMRRTKSSMNQRAKRSSRSGRGRQAGGDDAQEGQGRGGEPAARPFETARLDY